MKEISIKDLEDFLKISNDLENPFKFFEINDEIYAFVHMRTFLLSYSGENGKDRIAKLKEAGFIEATISETRKVELAEMV